MINSNKVVVNEFIAAGLIIITVIIAIWLGKLYTEKSVYETFKKIGIKALGIIALINIFNYSSNNSNELPDNSRDEES